MNSPTLNSSTPPLRNRLSAEGKSEDGLDGVVGGMTVIVMLAYTMRLLRGGIAAVGCSSMGAGSMGGENYFGNQV